MRRSAARDYCIWCHQRLYKAIILSTSSVAEDRWRALDLGADDYVVKPFGAGELAARVRAILRRTIPDGREPRPRDER